MKHLRRILARIMALRGSRTQDRDLHDELAAHLEMATADNIRRGMTPDNARRQALLQSGGIAQAAEAVRDQRGLPWIEHVAADLRYAIRSLRRAPGYSCIVVLTLGLGIGANTAIFSVVRGVLLKPLPNRDGERLVYLRQSADGIGRSNLNFSVPEIRDLRAGVPALGGGIAQYSPFTVVLQGADDATSLSAGLVTGNYFQVMGLAPILGRVTRPTDDGPGVPPVMVLTHDFWMQHYGGDSTVINRRVPVNGTVATIIGVLQPAPFFPLRMDVLMNMVISPHHIGAMMTEQRAHRMTEVVARLAPGATMAEARVQVASEFARLQAQYPDAYDRQIHQRVTVVPFRQAIGKNARLTLWLLMSAAAFVMIIAAANVANLTLIRGVSREHELVVRASLGSGVARLRRLLMVENLLVSGCGAALGALIAVSGLPLLVRFAGRFSPRANEIHLDGTVFGFALALALAVALLFSFIAFLPSERMLAAVAGASRRSTGGLRRQRLQRGLVVLQVAVSVVLLAGAGLLTRTVLRLTSVHSGLRSEDALTMIANLPGPGSTDAGVKAQYAQIQSGIAAVPGVTAVGLGSNTPLRSSGMGFEFSVEGVTHAAGEPVGRAELRSASPDYFRAAGIPLLRGRAFDATDQPASAQVLIVNQAFVDAYLHGMDPIGRRVAVASMTAGSGPAPDAWRTIVGVVGNTRDDGLEEPAPAAFYAPFAQQPVMGGALVIRSDRDIPSLIAATRRIVHGVSPATPLNNIATEAQLIDEEVAPRRLNAILIAAFAMLAVVIAAVGIAGVLAFSVGARTSEIGIRMSLGAQRGQVEGMILREGGVLVVLGIGLGVAGAWAGAGVLRGFLFGIAPHDPPTFGAVTAGMAVIGIAACWIPALRAARIDPAITMRSA